GDGRRGPPARGHRDARSGRIRPDSRDPFDGVGSGVRDSRGGGDRARTRRRTRQGARGWIPDAPGETRAAGGARSSGGHARIRKGDGMFELTLLDHLRLTYRQVVVRHRTHLQMAGWRARWSRSLRTAEALLMAGVAA